jgi:diguanylate cyclase (GGDEF)-like protein/PAS domain S-box-containing protein
VPESSGGGRPRLRRQAGPDRSAAPNLPELPPWLGALLFGVVVGAIVAVTVPTIGLPVLPVPVMAAAVLLGALAQPRAQRALAGGSLDRRSGWRIALAMTLFSTIAFGLGLPSMVPVFALVVGSIHLHWSGWRIWRTVAAQSLVLTVAGEVAVSLDWLPSIMGQAREMAVSGVFLVAGTQVLSNLGMTARRRAEIELELRRTESRFRSLVQQSQDVTAIVDLGLTITYISPAIARLTSRPVDEIRGSLLPDLLSPRWCRALEAALIRAEGAGPGATEELEVMVGAGTGNPRWLDVVVTNLLDDTAVGGFVLNATDVTERRRYREQLVHAATHDPLTALLNRAAFVTALQRELAEVSPTAEAWLFFCDLDGFKEINDGFGHDAGDAVLVHTARQLRRQAGGRSIVGRFGGDEFCVLVPPGGGACTDPHELRDLLAEAVSEPCRLPGGQHVRARGSFGLVVLDGSRLLADDVLRDADQRMYQRKRRSVPEPRWVGRGGGGG